MALKRPSTTSTDKKSSKAARGAPSQLSQTSRKGKKAWRKNIDLDEVQDALEDSRAEERILGVPLRDQLNEQLFSVDTKGDEAVRKAIKSSKKYQLTATRILSERSAVPAVASRITKKDSEVSYKEKGRLLRIGKRSRNGPLNSVVDHSQLGEGSALLEVSAAVKESGGYDVWAPTSEIVIKDGLDTVQRPKVKRPKLDHPRDHIEVPAIVAPHEGTSYNPTAQAHIDLIQKAYEKEQEKENKIQELASLRTKMHGAIQTPDTEMKVTGAIGMSLDSLEDDPDQVVNVHDVPLPKKAPVRKTKQQRAKAARLRAQNQALMQKAFRKRVLDVLSSKKALKTEIASKLAALEESRARRLQARLQKQKQGLSGQRLGKHRVPEGDVDVQLGDDLSESLRGLKPEGNLFRDRFISLQHRALVEPRPVTIAPKRAKRLKEYEKHAFKRFK